MADTERTVIDLNLIKPAESIEARKERLKKALQGRIEEFVRQFLPAATIQGNHARIGSVSGEKGQSCSINLDTGQFIDFADNRYKGDAFTLVQELGGYPDFKHTLDEVEKWLGLGLEPAALQVRREESLKAAQADEQLPKPALLNKAIYQYHDADGNHVANVAREDYTDGSKRFYQQSIGDDGTWQWKAPPKCHVYRLPDVKYQQSVVFVEGEKAADHLWNMNVPATTLMGGANTNLDKHDLIPLAGKNIILWPDNDDPGRDLMNKLKVRLTALGCLISEVKIPEDMPEKGDAADITEERIKEVLESAAGEAEDFERDDTEWPESWWEHQPEVIEDIMPMRGLSIVYGPSTVGKSFVVLDLAYRLATGQQIFNRDAVPSHVVYAAFEDPDGIQRRMRGIKTRDHQAPAYFTHHAPRYRLNTEEGWGFFNRYLVHKKAKVEEEGGPPLRVVVIDTLTSAIAGTDMSEGHAVADLMEKVSSLGRELDIMFIVVAHTGKDASKGVYGSVHFKNLADVLIRLMEGDDEISGERSIFIEKVKNGGKSNYTIMNYTLEDIFLGYKPNGKDIVTAVVKYHEPQVYTEPSLPDSQQKVLNVMENGKQAVWTIRDLINAGAGTDESNLRKVCDMLNKNSLISKKIEGNKSLFSLVILPGKSGKTG